jgi:hypothetical protein
MDATKMAKKKAKKGVWFPDSYTKKRGIDRVYITYSFDEYPDRKPSFERHWAPKYWDIDDETTLVNTWKNRAVRL